MAAFKQRWGYKGTETALNGLAGWLQENLQMKGRLHDRYLNACRIILQYGIKEIDGFSPRGHLENKADFIAKHVQRNDKFQHFVNWVRKNYDEFGNLKTEP